MCFKYKNKKNDVNDPLYNPAQEKYGKICAVWNNTVTINKYQTWIVLQLL
jgi:hypothetical protein